MTNPGLAMEIILGQEKVGVTKTQTGGIQGPMVLVGFRGRAPGIKEDIVSRFSSMLENRQAPGAWSYLVMWGWASVCGIILTLALFLRLAPYGQPYVMDNLHYLPHAIYYLLFGLSLIIAPFMLCNLVMHNDAKHPVVHRIGQTACAILVTLSLLVGHVDNEVLRFANMHLSPDFLRTYLVHGGVPDAMWNMFAEDAGGANVSLYLLAVPAIFLVGWFAFGHRIPRPKRLRWWLHWSIWGVIIVWFIAFAFLFRSSLFGSKNRQALVAPPAVLLYNAYLEWRYERVYPDDMPQRMARSRELWDRYNHAAWEPVDPQKPWLRHYTGTCVQPDKKYNVILVVFESFRAHSLHLWNPEARSGITPFVEKLAQSPDAAMYTNYYTNGHPTIAAFMAFHTGLYPQSGLTVAKIPGIHPDSFVNMLRKHGYQTAFFGGSDPDWDNQRLWLRQWYDVISYKRENDEQDRLVMHDAREWLLHQRDAGKPFMMTTLLISNHMPFHLPEEKFRVTDSDELYEKIYNTMHYDDDVLREFVESIQNEPWFEDTILIVTGDHGMDLGDRGASPDYNNLHVEALHLPLVIYGKHPRIPHGEQTQPGSHVDLGPTVLDLLGICDDVNMHGHSLLDLDPDRPVFAYKAHRAAMFSPQWSAYVLENDTVMLFEASDKKQERDVAAEHPDVAESMRLQLRDLSLTVDYGYAKDLYAPASLAVSKQNGDKK